MEAELAALKVEVAALKAERARNAAAAAAAAAVAGREGSPSPDWVRPNSWPIEIPVQK